MSDFFKELAKKGADNLVKQVDKKAPSWVDKAHKEVIKAADSIKNETLKEVTKKSAETLFVDNKDAIVDLSKEGLAAVVGLLALDDKESANLIFLEKEASFKELIDAKKTARVKTEAARKKQEESIKKLLNIGADVAKSVLPILLKTLPI